MSLPTPKSLLRCWKYQSVQNEKVEVISCHFLVTHMSLYVKLSSQSKQPLSGHTLFMYGQMYKFKLLKEEK